MRYALLILAVVLLGQALWALYRSVRRRNAEDLPIAIGSACLLIALFTPLKWLAFVGLGLIVWARYLARPDPRPPEIRNVPHSGARPTPSSLPFRASLGNEHSIRVPVSALEMPVEGGGHLVVEGPTLGAWLRLDSAPEASALVVESQVSDASGRVWFSESAFPVERLKERLDRPTSEREPGKIALDRAPSSWRLAFDSAALLRGVTLKSSNNGTATLDLALLNQETVVVAERAGDERTAALLPVRELLWYLEAGGHLVRRSESWSAPDDGHPLAFRRTGERDAPARNVHFRA